MMPLGADASWTGTWLAPASGNKNKTVQSLTVDKSGSVTGQGVCSNGSCDWGKANKVSLGGDNMLAVFEKAGVAVSLRQKRTTDTVTAYLNGPSPDTLTLQTTQ